jgi:IS30 family transposase
MAHLAQAQRYEISTLKKEGHSNIYIAQKIGFNRSSIGRELNRNSDEKKGYVPEVAQKKAEKRRENREAYKLDNQMSTKIDTMLKIQYSPEQIVGTMKKKGEKIVSHESIYQYIYADKKKGGSLYENLRFQRKKRRKRLAIKDRRGIIPNKKMIAERPKEVAEKVRFGDWEGDTIVGKDHQGAILTLVERISKLTFMIRLEGRNSESVEKEIVKFFREKNCLVLQLPLTMERNLPDIKKLKIR